MTIQIRCSQCSRLLELPDEAAGQRSQCPFCQNIQAVPEAVVNDAVGDTTSDATTTFTVLPPVTSFTQSFMQPTLRERLAVGNLFTETWRVYWHQFGLMVMLGLLAVVPPMLAMRCIVLAGVDLTGFKLQNGEVIEDMYARILPTLWVFVVGVVFVWCWQLWVWVDSLRMVLHLVRTGEVCWSLFFAPLSLVVRMVLGACLLCLVVMAASFAFVVVAAIGIVLVFGLVAGLTHIAIGGNNWVVAALAIFAMIPLVALCVLFVVWISSRLSVWMLGVIDGCGVRESIARSWRATRGVVWPIFVAIFCLGLLTMAINVVTLSVGSIFVIGFSYTMMATIYNILIASGVTILRVHDVAAHRASTVAH